VTDNASRPGLQAVTSALLHEQVARQLRQLILEGVLAPGSRLSERQLGDQLGVSRTPLREALRALAGEGLVELLPRRGAQVARLRPEDVAHIFPVMEALEALAGALACEAMSDAQIKHARGLHQHLVAAYRAGDEDAFFAWNRQIHEHILQGAANPVLLKIYEGLSGQMRRARYMALNNKQQWRQAVAEHETIIAALTDRDGERLSAALSTHLKSKRGKIMKNLVTEAPAAERKVAGTRGRQV
jgi:DNA-binding GntR family transcriptional regulator